MHTPLNQRYWDIITAEFEYDGTEDEYNELFGVDAPLMDTIPEEFMEEHWFLEGWE